MSTSWEPPPLPPPPPPPPLPGVWAPPGGAVPSPFPTLPFTAAVVAAGLTILVLTANKVVIRALADQEWPVAVYLCISVVIGYGPLLAMVFWVCRRWGTGSLRRDLGFDARAVDLGWGPLTWLSALVGQVMMGLIVTILQIPVASNTAGIGSRRSEEAYVVALLVMAVIAAPFIEEMVFRGVVLRGLASRMHVWVAVPVQGVLFGAVHADPVFGWGNVGLVMVLSAVGCVLGGATVLIRRLAPSILAHAIVNGIALTLVLTGVADRLRDMSGS